MSRHAASPLVGTAALVFAAVMLLSSTALVITAPASSASSPGSETTLVLAPTTRTPIQHVIIAIYENHALDNYFSQFPDVFGEVPGGVPQPWTQTNITGYTTPYYLNWNYAVSSSPEDNETSDDPDHDVPSIRGNIDNGSMDGYTYTDTNVSVGMFPTYITPNMHGLAQQYALGDDYFHVLAGPTLPNRFYYYADTSGPITSDSGPANGSNEVYFNTMPRELEEYGLTWASYDGSYDTLNSTCILDVLCNDPSFYFSTTLSQLMPMLYLNWIQEYEGQLGHLQPYSNLFSALDDGTLPAVSWYTPDWLCCTEHPGTIDGFGGNITQGEQSLLELVYAVEDSPYWNSTALFISFDEGGGFYDDVPPPQTTPVGDGVRMPLLVISPYAKEGYVSHTYLTPSSLLHFIEWNWNLPSLEGGGPGLDTEANLPLDFFNFTAAPRPPLPGNIPGPNNLTSYPWPYTQPVSSSYLGTYKSPLVANGEVSWAVTTRNVILSQPVQTSDGSILYETGMDGILRAVDPVFGTVDWSRSLGQASRTQPALLPEDGVIATTLRGDITAYSSTGTLLWNDSLGAPIYSGLTTVQGNYYGALSNGSLFEVSENGTVVWEKDLTWGPIYAPLTYDATSGLLLASAGTQGVVAVTLAGTSSWTTGIPGGVYATGAVNAGTFYVCGTQGGLYALDTTSGAITSTGPLAAPCVTPPTISGGTLYIGNESGAISAYSTVSLAAPLWTTQLWGDVAGAPALYQGSLWVGTGGGDLDELSPSTGAVSRVLNVSAPMYAGPLATATGLYFGAYDGNLYAFNEGGWLHATVTPTNGTITVGGASVPSPGGSANLVLAAGPISVAASAPGYVTQTASLTVPVGGATWINFSLSPGGVKPGTLEAMLSPTAATLSVNGTAQPNQPTGVYALTESPGPLSLSAAEAGYQSQSTIVQIDPGAFTYWNVTLLPTGVSTGLAEGTVTSSLSGLPVSGADVTFLPGRLSVTTGVTGAYEEHLGSATYSVFVNATGYQPYVGAVTVTAPGTSWWNVSLTPTSTTGAMPGTISGVVDNTSAGHPVVGAVILFEPSGTEATSTSNGSYSVSLPAGTYSLFVNASGYQAYTVAGLLLLSGGSLLHDILLAPVPHSTSPGGTGSTGGSSPIDPLLLLLLLALIVAAAAVVVAVLYRRRKDRQEGEAYGGAAAGYGALMVTDPYASPEPPPDASAYLEEPPPPP